MTDKLVSVQGYGSGMVDVEVLMHGTTRHYRCHNHREGPFLIVDFGAAFNRDFSDDIDARQIVVQVVRNVLEGMEVELPMVLPTQNLAGR